MSWVFDGAQRRDEPPPASASGYAMLCPQATTLNSPRERALPHLPRQQANSKL